MAEKEQKESRAARAARLGSPDLVRFFRGLPDEPKAPKKIASRERKQPGRKMARRGARGQRESSAGV